MAQSLEAVRRKMGTAQDLHSVVRTMKGLAAASVRQFQKAVESLGDYRRTIEMGLQVILQRGPERLAVTRGEEAERLAVVVFGSDQGMCGRFNQQIASHALAEMDTLGAPPDKRTVVAVGTLIIPLLELAGQPVAERLAPPSSAAGIARLVREILLRVQTWNESREIAQVVLFYNESLGGAAYRPLTHRLVPVDLQWLEGLRERDWDSRSLPIFTVGWRELFSALLREHFFIELYRASAESLASENASRLAAMQGAERNIEELLDVLTRAYRLQRQATITEELFDIVAGFEALSGGTAG